jgi:carbamoyltransferase
MTILGISGLLTDAAVAIAKDTELCGAVEEEKVSRQFRPGELPQAAMQSCLAMAGVKAEAIDHIALVRPVGTGLKTDLHLQLRSRFPNARVSLVGHHAAHSASAYYASPYDQATVLTLDRTGDFRCGARWKASGNQVVMDRELHFPDSLGDLYGRVTELLGFHAGADEHKVQWLSTAGDDRFRDLFLDMMPSREGQWPRMDRSYFATDRLDSGGFSAKFYARLGIGDGAPVPEPLRAAVAAGLQQAIEATVIEMAGAGENLCLAGGLCYNALLVAALERSGRFANVFVQPNAGNSGAALGAVFHTRHVLYGETARLSTGNFCLGPSFSAEEIKQVLENCKLRFRYLLTASDLIDAALAQLNDHKIVAWMHGRMEFGPRALGNRSILASPLDPYSTENLNIYIKHREGFRKFAASVPAEVAGEYFEVGPNARFLATVGKVRPACRDRLQSAILGADTIRVHTVAEQDNPLYWKLLHAAGRSTGLPVLYNTSFNLFGDPLVCTPRDAVRSFYSSGIDALFVGNFLVQK